MFRKSIYLVITFVFIFAFSQTQAAEDRPEVGPNVKVYEGGEGVKVIVLRTAGAIDLRSITTR